MPMLRHFTLSLSQPYSVIAEHVTQYCNEGLVWGEKSWKETWKSLTSRCNVKINASDQQSTAFYAQQVTET